MSESETTPSPETPQYSREQVVEMFKQLCEATQKANPFDLYKLRDNPAVKAADAALDDWNRRARAQAAQSPDPGAILEHDLLSATVYYDAGFDDPVFLEEVAGDWLNQSWADADQSGLTEVAARIKAKMEEIDAKLPPSMREMP